jgi:hypothetical protein
MPLEQGRTVGKFSGAGAAQNRLANALETGLSAGACRPLPVAISFVPPAQGGPAPRRQEAAQHCDVHSAIIYGARRRDAHGRRSTARL